jgi:hypothetical protein
MKKFILFCLLAIPLVSCSSSRIPNNVNSAKRIVERNKKQIDAIVSFHNLDSPFVIDTTISFKYEKVLGSTYFPNNLKREIDSLFDGPLFININEPKEEAVERIREKIIRIVDNNKIDYIYDDEFISIRISQSDSLVNVDYKIKEREVFEEVSFEGSNIDIKRKLIDDGLFRFAILAIILFLLIKLISNQIKNE